MVKIFPVKNVGSGSGVFKQETASNENELRSLIAGGGIEVAEGTNEVQISAPGLLPVLNDNFTDAEKKPFWENTEVFTSGDWQFDAANDRLTGIAENNQSDWYRRGIEGDADHSFKITHNSGSSVGIWFIGNGIDVEAEYLASTTQMEFRATGRTDITLSVTLTDPFWIRLVRTLDDISMYWKQNDNDPWILVGTHSNLNLGSDMTAELESETGAYIHRVILYDNSFNGSATKAKFVKEIPLTDAATISVDASMGNLFTVTLGGNRTLGAPTNGKQGQMIVFRIAQDATGSRTLAFNSVYRFSTDIPSPTLSTAANAIDYLGFIYNEADSKWDCIGKVFGF